MAASTKNLKPVIVYLSEEDHAQVAAIGSKYQHSLSHVCRNLLVGALATPRDNYGGHAQGWSTWDDVEGQWHWWARFDNDVLQGVKPTKQDARTAAQAAYQRLRRHAGSHP